jgi:hypothetical protein
MAATAFPKQDDELAPEIPGQMPGVPQNFNPLGAASKSAQSPNQMLAAAGPAAPLNQQPKNPLDKGGADANNKPMAANPASTTNAQAAATAQQAAGNSTAGTTPPPTAVGSGLPAYAANWNFWQNGSQPAGPGANTVYNAPGSLGAMGVDQNTAGYDPNANNAPVWSQPTGSSKAAYDALQGILGGDASGMDTSAIKNRLKEQRLIMEKDQGRQSRQAAAGRGMLDSGYQASQERRISNESKKDILGGFRDVDIAAADASVKNKLAGSEALNQILTGDVNRADTGWKNQFAGTEFEDKQNQFNFNAGQEKFNNQVNAGTQLGNLQREGANSALNSWQAGADNTMKGRDQDIQVAQHKTNELLTRMGLAVNLEEIQRGTSRDKMQFLTDIFQTLVQNEQHNAQMGLNYSQLGQSMNQTVMDLAKSIGL